MEAHKRTLAILHIIYGGLTLSAFIIINTLIRSIWPFIQSEIGDDDLMIFQTFAPLLLTLGIFLMIIIALPSIIGGIGLLYGKRWGLVLLLISGCLSLLSFPIGMALGAYTIWVFVQSGQEKKQHDQDQG